MAKSKIDKNTSNISSKQNLYAVMAGGLAGLVNGLFGGGGGMIVVPMLTGLLKRDPKRAHATALIIRN